jgi:uncharacterized membrane protein YebE (DUF533 family)
MVLLVSKMLKNQKKARQMRIKRMNYYTHANVANSLSSRLLTQINVAAAAADGSVD